jgi:hypothetical protein
VPQTLEERQQPALEWRVPLPRGKPVGAATEQRTMSAINGSLPVCKLISSQNCLDTEQAAQDNRLQCMACASMTCQRVWLLVISKIQAHAPLRTLRPNSGTNSLRCLKYLRYQSTVYEPWLWFNRHDRVYVICSQLTRHGVQTACRGSTTA